MMDHIGSRADQPDLITDEKTPNIDDYEATPNIEEV